MENCLVISVIITLKCPVPSEFPTFKTKLLATIHNFHHLDVENGNASCETAHTHTWHIQHRARIASKILKQLKVLKNKNHIKLNVMEHYPAISKQFFTNYRSEENFTDSYSR